MLATQNPIEQEGTYPLPEAQLDRFLVQIDVPYPSLDAERRMLFATTGAAEEQPEKVLSTTELMNAQRLTRLIPVGEQVAEAILRVVRAARPGPEADEFVNRNVAWGPSPARPPGADAGRARPRPAAGPAVALARRRDGADGPGVPPPHGAELHGARRRPHHRRHDRAALEADRLTG